MNARNSELLRTGLVENWEGVGHHIVRQSLILGHWTYCCSMPVAAVTPAEDLSRTDLERRVPREAVERAWVAIWALNPRRRYYVVDCFPCGVCPSRGATSPSPQSYSDSE